MGVRLYTKPEPANVQGMCLACGDRKQSSKGRGTYRPICRRCHVERHNVTLTRGRPWHRHKGATCERCKFVPEHPCQLDVDHRDGDRANNDPSNWQTLCANCHRLKTYQNADWQ